MRKDRAAIGESLANILGRQWRPEAFRIPMLVGARHSRQTSRTAPMPRWCRMRTPTAVSHAQSVSTPGTYIYNTAGQDDTLKYSTEPYPQLSAETINSGSAVATADWGNPGEFGQGDSTSAYYFTVTGPAGAVDIQVHAAGTISAQGGSTANTYNGFFSYTAYPQFGVYPNPRNQPRSPTPPRAWTMDFWPDKAISAKCWIRFYDDRRRFRLGGVRLRWELAGQ